MPSSPTAGDAVIGVWTTASRQTVRMINDGKGTSTGSGPWVQVSRLGMPLVNEVVVPVSLKDYFNSQPPVKDSQFAAAVANPELAKLIPVLYPGAFPNLAAYNAASPNRADLVAILLTGIPAGVVPGFQNLPPTRVGHAAPQHGHRARAKPSNLGLVGGDPAGFPNGRALFHETIVATIELRAVAGVTLPLVDPSQKADAAAGSDHPLGLSTSGAS